MPNPKLVEVLRVKDLSLVNDLDERGQRRWAATEAMAIGHGGILTVATATGLGRKPLEHHDQTLQPAVEALIEPTERGDPQSPMS